MSWTEGEKCGWRGIRGLPSKSGRWYPCRGASGCAGRPSGRERRQSIGPRHISAIAAGFRADVRKILPSSNPRDPFARFIECPRPPRLGDRPGGFRLLFLQGAGNGARRGPAARLPAGRGGAGGPRPVGGPGEPADRAGLRTGDEILAADGRRVTSVAEYEAAAAGFERGRPVALRIARGGRTSTSRPSPARRRAGCRFLLNVLTALGFLAVALLALAQGADLRVGLLVAFSTAVAVEIALPVDVIGRPLLGAAALSAYYLLTGLQIGLEMHLTLADPGAPGLAAPAALDRAALLRRRPRRRGSSPAPPS